MGEILLLTGRLRWVAGVDSNTTMALRSHERRRLEDVAAVAAEDRRYPERPALKEAMEVTVIQTKFTAAVVVAQAVTG